MSLSLPRRRLLAVAVPGLFAGCFEQPDGTVFPEESGGESEEGTEPEGGGGADDENGTDDGGETDDEGADEPDGDATDESDGEVTATPPDRVDPEDAGITITDVEIVDVATGGSRTTVTARLTVRNDGRFTYGLLEFRTDAYTTTPNSRKREAVGHVYTTRRFSGDNRFDDGTRRVNVEVTFPNKDASFGSNADWYEVTAAVRRAEPVAE